MAVASHFRLKSPQVTGSRAETGCWSTWDELPGFPATHLWKLFVFWSLACTLFLAKMLPWMWMAWHGIAMASCSGLLTENHTWPTSAANIRSHPNGHPWRLQANSKVFALLRISGSSTDFAMPWSDLPRRGQAAAHASRQLPGGSPWQPGPIKVSFKTSVGRPATATPRPHMPHTYHVSVVLIPADMIRYADIRQKLLSNQNIPKHVSLLRSDLFKDCNWSRATRTFQQSQNSASGSLKYLNMPTGEKNNFPEWICNVRVHKLGCQYQFTLKIALFWHYTIHFAGEQFWAIPKCQLDWSREKKTWSMWSDQREWANLISVFGRTVVQNHLQTLHRGHEGRLLLNAATPKPIQNHQNPPGTFGRPNEWRKLGKLGENGEKPGGNRQKKPTDLTGSDRNSHFSTKNPCGAPSQACGSMEPAGNTVWSSNDLKYIKYILCLQNLTRILQKTSQAAGRSTFHLSALSGPKIWDLSCSSSTASTGARGVFVDFPVSMSCLAMTFCSSTLCLSLGTDMPWYAWNSHKAFTNSSGNHIKHIKSSVKLQHPSTIINIYHLGHENPKLPQLSHPTARRRGGTAARRSASSGPASGQGAGS